MVQRTPKYSIVLVAFAIACALTYWVSLKPVQALFDADLKSMPMKIGSWHGEDMPLDEATRKSLGADEIISRLYSDDLPDQITLFVLYRKYGRRDFCHRPEMCYPAAGYEIVSKQYVKVPYGGKELDAVQVVAQKDDDRVLILYWFASGDRTEANFAKQQIQMSLDRLRPRKFGWAFVRVTCPVIYSDDDAMQRIRSFLSDASRPLEYVLTHSRPADGGKSN